MSYDPSTLLGRPEQFVAVLHGVHASPHSSSARLGRYEKRTQEISCGDAQVTLSKQVDMQRPPAVGDGSNMVLVMGPPVDEEIPHPESLTLPSPSYGASYESTLSIYQSLV